MMMGGVPFLPMPSPSFNKSGKDEKRRRKRARCCCQAQRLRVRNHDLRTEGAVEGVIVAAVIDQLGERGEAMTTAVGGGAEGKEARRRCSRPRCQAVRATMLGREVGKGALTTIVGWEVASSPLSAMEKVLGKRWQGGLDDNNYRRGGRVIVLVVVVGSNPSGRASNLPHRPQ